MCRIHRTLTTFLSHTKQDVPVWRNWLLGFRPARDHEQCPNNDVIDRRTRWVEIRFISFHSFFLNSTVLKLVFINSCDLVMIESLIRNIWDQPRRAYENNYQHERWAWYWLECRARSAPQVLGGLPLITYAFLHAFWTPYPLFACNTQLKCMGGLTPPPSPRCVRN